MEKEQILNAYQFRHACKEFDPDKTISEEDFNFILETGRLSPSSFGLEPWKFIVVQDRSLRERLLPVTWGAQRTLPTASHFVIILSRTKEALAADSSHIQYMMKEIKQMPDETAVKVGQMYQNFLEEDFTLWENDRAVFEWGCRQSYIALGNMMTSAALIGIDSCPIEGFDKVKVEQLLDEEGILQNGEFGVSCMVAFGYRLQDPPREKTRQPRSRVIEWI